MARLPPRTGCSKMLRSAHASRTWKPGAAALRVNPVSGAAHASREHHDLCPRARSGFCQHSHGRQSSALLRCESVVVAWRERPESLLLASCTQAVSLGLDWRRIHAQTDDDIRRAIRTDRDAAPEVDAAWFKSARVVMPEPKQAVSLRLDREVRVFACS